MACPILLKDVAGSITVFLTLSSDGTAATGLTHTDVTVSLKKEGESSFTLKSLTASDFTEIGSGFYELDLSATDLDTTGNLYVKIEGSTISTVLESVNVATSSPSASTDDLTVTQTSLFGYILDADGSSVENAGVSAKVLSAPAVLRAEGQAYVLVDDIVSVKTDASGFFTLNLITGSTVDVFIPSANYRRTLVVPSSNVNLFSIP